MKEVWRWREALTSGMTDESVEKRLREITRRGDEAARRFGLDDAARTADRVAETAVDYVAK
jgi:hypothetical protein